MGYKGDVYQIALMSGYEDTRKISSSKQGSEVSTRKEVHEKKVNVIVLIA